PPWSIFPPNAGRLQLDACRPLGALSAQEPEGKIGAGREQRRCRYGDDPGGNDGEEMDTPDQIAVAHFFRRDGAHNRLAATAVAAHHGSPALAPLGILLAEEADAEDGADRNMGRTYGQAE